jgi:hypothetical protein
MASFAAAFFVVPAVFDGTATGFAFVHVSGMQMIVTCPVPSAVPRPPTRIV